MTWDRTRTIQTAQRGLQEWADKPHNRRWFKHIDGTPIVNDLPICIANAFYDEMTTAQPPPAVGAGSEEQVEIVARAIDPGSWRVMDNYLAEVKRKYAGENAAYDPEAFKHKESMAKARAILSALSLPCQGERVLSVAEDAVISERSRQVMVEGWTAEHDDEHSAGELLTAAVCYAQRRMDAWRFGSFTPSAPAAWPWDLSWWKPKDERRDLVRAAALIIAEIERLDRLAAAPLGGEEGK